jgi:hypothetical protein
MKKTDIFIKFKEVFRQMTGLIYLCSFLTSISMILTFALFITAHQVKLYERYYQASETLLDSLESNFNWIDAYDPGPAYDEYINAKEDL